MLKSKCLYVSPKGRFGLPADNQLGISKTGLFPQLLVKVIKGKRGHKHFEHFCKVSKVTCQPVQCLLNIVDIDVWDGMIPIWYVISAETVDALSLILDSDFVSGVDELSTAHIQNQGSGQGTEKVKSSPSNVWCLS